MTKIERVFHSVLFEVVAIVILALFLVDNFSQSYGEAAFLAITTSTMAMFWNYFYNIFNYLYDQIRFKVINLSSGILHD